MRMKDYRIIDPEIRIVDTSDDRNIQVILGYILWLLYIILMIR